SQELTPIHGATARCHLATSTSIRCLNSKRVAISTLLLPADYTCFYPATPPLRPPRRQNAPEHSKLQQKVPHHQAHPYVQLLHSSNSSPLTTPQSAKLPSSPPPPPPTTTPPRSTLTFSNGTS